MESWLNTFWSYLAGLFTELLEIIFKIIGWVFYCIFDGFLAVVYAFVQALDLSSVAFGVASQWTNLPNPLIWLVNSLALPQCITIIAGAMTIRLLLNLIPAAFTRI